MQLKPYYYHIMILLLFIFIALSSIDVCKSAAPVIVTAYNTGYIVQAIYSDKNCTNNIAKFAVVLGQCIYLNSQSFNENKIINTTKSIGIAGVKYQWDYTKGLLPTVFYSDEDCTKIDATKVPGSGFYFSGLDKCDLYNNGLNSFKMSYLETYDKAVPVMKSMDNYTFITSYGTKEICQGKKTGVPVYMESKRIDYCYADTGATSMDVKCQDRTTSYTRNYPKSTTCDSSKEGYSVQAYQYAPSCSDKSLSQYSLTDKSGTPYDAIVAGYEVSSCGVYDDSIPITVEFVLPIALAAFFFSVTFCLCFYIFCFLHRGGLKPPPKFTKEHFQTASV